MHCVHVYLHVFLCALRVCVQFQMMAIFSKSQESEDKTEFEYLLLFVVYSVDTTERIDALLKRGGSIGRSLECQTQDP